MVDAWVHGEECHKQLRLDSSRKPIGIRAVSSYLSECSRCDVWRRRCADLEAALSLAELRKREAMRKRNYENSKVSPEPAGKGVDASTQVDPTVTIDLGCQTAFSGGSLLTGHSELIHQSTQVDLADCWQVVSVCTQTDKIEVGHPRRHMVTRGTQGKTTLAVQDVGCLAILDDEQHFRQRQELLAKIDALLKEKEQLQQATTDAQRESRNLRLHVEAMLCHTDAPVAISAHLEPCQDTNLDEQPPYTRACTADETKRVTNEVHSAWAEFSSGRVETEELGRRLATRRVASQQSHRPGTFEGCETTYPSSKATGHRKRNSRSESRASEALPVGFSTPRTTSSRSGNQGIETPSSARKRQLRSDIPCGTVLANDVPSHPMSRSFTRHDEARRRQSCRRPPLA